MRFILAPVLSVRTRQKYSKSAVLPGKCQRASHSITIFCARNLMTTLMMSRVYLSLAVITSEGVLSFFRAPSDVIVLEKMIC